MVFARFQLCLCLTSLLAVTHVRPAIAQEPLSQEISASQRLEIMQRVIEGFQFGSQKIQNPSQLKFGSTPLLRYSDQTRNLLDASVWRLGERGRPMALVTVELTRKNSGPSLSCEVTSLSTSPFNFEAAGHKTWELTGTDLAMKRLSAAQSPGPTERARLTQMRELARRFAVHETIAENKIECRLMPQPIDRYADAESEILDGAAFAFANGTNPEVGILLETDGKTWSYGAFRLSTAAILVELDGRAVVELPKIAHAALPGPYIARILPQPLTE
jgi:hypothetical protein